MTFPALTYWKVLETSEVVTAGGITCPDNLHLQYVYMMIFKKGDGVGSERMRLKLYSSSSGLIATSDWSAISDIEDLPTDWRGRLLFTFATKVWISNDCTYLLKVETDSYTRNLDAFYIACMYDWPYPINDNAEAPEYGLAFELYGQRGVDYEF